MGLADQIGRGTLRGLAYLGGLAQLGGRAASSTFIPTTKARRVRPQRAIHQAMAVGVEALPVLSVITFFIGVIMALQGAYELRQFGAIQYVASAVAISITRELGPFVTAIVVIGRSGSAFAAAITSATEFAFSLFGLTSSTVTKRAVSEIGAKSFSESNGIFLYRL